jgi:hypothetical protein
VGTDASVCFRSPDRAEPRADFPLETAWIRQLSHAGACRIPGTWGGGVQDHPMALVQAVRVMLNDPWAFGWTQVFTMSGSSSRSLLRLGALKREKDRREENQDRVRGAVVGIRV